MAGIFYGWIGIYYGTLAKMQDTWAYHYESLKEYQWLLHHPVTFFTSIFHNPFENGYSNFLSSTDSWWNNLHGKIMIKLLAILNLFSFGNYFINVILYSFITLFGPIALYRIMQDVFPNKKGTVLLAIFLIPSFLYWTSGIHKDGLVFTALALIVYVVYFSLKRQRLSARGIITLTIGFLVILAVRNFLLLILLPALAAWILAQRLKWKPLVTFMALYAIYVLLFFSVRYIHPALDLPQAVVTKQYDFMQLEGGSAVPTVKLQPSFKSFIMAAPAAISMALLRPYPADVRHLLSLAAAVEIDLLLLLFVLSLLWRSNGLKLTPFLLFCLFLSFSTLLTIGYTVNFLGAVVRYRSIIWPFLMAPFIVKINWSKMMRLLAGNINK